MYKYGEIYYANLPIQPNSQIQQGIRPVIVVSNDKNNYYSTVVHVVPLTAKTTKHNLPTHVKVNGFGLSKPSIALCEQIIPIDKCRIMEKVGFIDNPNVYNSIQKAMMIQLNIVA